LTNTDFELHAFSNNTSTQKCLAERENDRNELKISYIINE
jgi:hypothetical protein